MFSFLLKKRKKPKKVLDTSMVEGVRRLVIDGKEYLVRDVKAVTERYVVVEDVFGNIISIPIEKLREEDRRVFNDLERRAVLL